MDLTDDDVRAFIDVWERAYDERLAPDDARQRALELLELYTTLYEIACAHRTGTDGIPNATHAVLPVLPKVD